MWAVLLTIREVSCYKDSVRCKSQRTSMRFLKFLFSVNILMHNEHRLLNESFPTKCTLVRFNSSVRCLVFIQIGSASEGLSTLSTHIRFLSSVYSLMYLEL